MSNFVLGVVAHVSRQDQIAELHDKVGPDVVFPDDGSLGPGANHLTALKRLHALAKQQWREWVIVLEDDALPVESFREEAEVCLDYAPAPIVSFYNGTGYPLEYQKEFAAATATDVRWIKHQGLRHAVAYAVHQGVLWGGLIEHMTPLVRNNWAADDAISSWARIHGEMVAYTNPSMVDHNDKIASVITKRTSLGITVTGRKPLPRRAHRVGLPTHWNDKAVTI